MVYYEVSRPICVRGPTASDLELTRQLEEELKRFDYFEAKDEHVRRLNALRAVNSLVNRWVKYVSWQKGLPPEQVERAGGKLFTFGSYRLGVHTRGADIDSLCVVPRHVHRRDFFTSFYQMLKEDENVTGLHGIEQAFVPVIKLKYNGIELDILFARLDVNEITAETSLNDDNLLKNLDEKSVRSLNGCRVADEIWRSIPNKTAFTVALRAIKLWAKNRLIYSNSLGFLGGISWAILVAKTCQLYPNANASMIIEKLFKLFSTWDWPAPVFIKDPNSHTRPDIPYLNDLVWDPKTKPTDGRHLMPIITPAFPEQDSAFNVTRSARTLITKEFRQGLENVIKIVDGKGDWKSLFNEMLFFKGYKDYICVICSTSTPEDHVVYSGLVESKIRHLVMLLDQNEYILLCHVNKKNFKPRHNSRFAADYGFGSLVTTLWFIGLVKVRNSTRMLDLEEETHHFTELVTSSALQAGIYKPSMQLRLAQVKDIELKAWIPTYEVDGYEQRTKQDAVTMPVPVGDDPHYDEHGRPTIPNIDDGTKKVAYCSKHAYHLETVKVPTKVPDCFPREVVHPFLPLNACYANRRQLTQEQPAGVSNCECPQCSQRE